MTSERESRSLPSCPVWFRGLEQSHGNLTATECCRASPHCARVMQPGLTHRLSSECAAVPVRGASSLAVHDDKLLPFLRTAVTRRPPLVPIFSTSWSKFLATTGLTRPMRSRGDFIVVSLVNTSRRNGHFERCAWLQSRARRAQAFQCRETLRGSLTWTSKTNDLCEKTVCVPRVGRVTRNATRSR